MKRRVTHELLKQAQNRILHHPNPHLEELYSLSYSLIDGLIQDIKKPFKKICIHGRYPSIILPALNNHNRKFNLKNNDFSITLVDYIRNQNTETLLTQNQYPVRELRYIESPDLWMGDENVFDLILTNFQLHHANSEEQLLKKYLRTLSPDGAIIGCSFGEGNLHELYWSYLMAENQRCGGISPKVLSFTPLGQLGSYLTTANYQLITIMAYQEILEFQSVVDLISLLQSIGESGYLRGRRKGIYKDLLLAASALYSSQYRTSPLDSQNNSITSTLFINKFIAWKYDQSQPKKGRKGPNVDSIQFIEQLRKFDTQAESYLIEQDDPNPKKLS